VFYITIAAGTVAHFSGKGTFYRTKRKHFLYISFHCTTH